MTSKTINQLVDSVEESILDLFHQRLSANAGGVAIQPFRNWTNKSAVEDFKNILRDNFRKVLENT